jgi:hypothetical protein
MGSLVPDDRPIQPLGATGPERAELRSDRPDARVTPPTSRQRGSATPTGRGGSAGTPFR